MNNNKIELLAPAGNLEKLKTAIAFGADAVYLGIPDFSLRVRINDFDLDAVKRAVFYCHKLNKKVYVTINIFAHNRHLKKIPNYIKLLKKIKVDALIVSDPGIITEIKTVWPKAIIHLSTQANCTNWQSALFWQRIGVKRIILGREVSLAEIKEINEKCPKLELEYFVHGAMCMAYSGRCFLSKYYMDKSANLGDCVQPCRWKYNHTNNNNSQIIYAQGHENEELELIEEEHGSYILNSKDLCLIKYLHDLREAGVCSFKIEGRAKSVYYQAIVAGIYSHAIRLYSLDGYNLQITTQKEINFLYNELETKLVHRGYTNGFLLGGKADQNVLNSHNKCEWEFCGQVCLIENEKLQPTNKRKRIKNLKDNYIFVKVHNSIRVGDEIEIVQPKYDIIKMRVKRLIDVESGEELNEAHGGQNKKVYLEIKNNIAEYSVIRRKI